MKTSLTVFIIFLLLGVSHSQQLVDFDPKGDLSENVFYQKYKETVKSQIIKYNEIRDRVFSSNLSSDEKVQCLSLIKLIFDLEEDVETTYLYLEHIEHPIFHFIDNDSFRNDLYNLNYCYSEMAKIEKNHENQPKLILSNEEILFTEEESLSPLKDSFFYPNSRVLLKGGLGLSSLPYREDLNYVYSFNPNFGLSFHEQNYFDWKDSEYLSKLKMEFYMEEDSENINLGTFDTIFDNYYLTNIDKDQLENRIDYLSDMLHSKGFLFLTLAKQVMRPWHKDGKVYCGSDKQAKRVSKKKLKKILQRQSMEFIQLTEWEFMNVLILRKLE